MYVLLGKMSQSVAGMEWLNALSGTIAANTGH